MVCTANSEGKFSALCQYEVIQRRAQAGPPRLPGSQGSIMCKMSSETTHPDFPPSLPSLPSLPSFPVSQNRMLAYKSVQVRKSMTMYPKCASSPESTLTKAGGDEGMTILSS
jgi:hypothetical protein